MSSTCNPHKLKLQNGVRLLTDQMPGVRSTAIGIWIFAGSRNERPEERGITHFIEHMFFKGTKKHDAITIGQIFNLLGGQFNAFTTQESLCIYARVIDEHLDEALGLLAEMILESTFPEDEIDRERNVILEEIKMCDDTPDDHVVELFQQNLWPEHPIGRPVLGTPKTVRSFRRKNLNDYFKRELCADRMNITIAGNFNRRAVSRKVESLFDSISSRPSASDANGKVAFGFRQRGARFPIEQIHFCVGTQAPPRAHKDRYALGLASTILGGGMGSRLFEEIREKRGLAYCISTINSAFIDTGYIGITGATAIRALPKVLDLVVKEVRRLYTDSVSQDELDRARQQIASQTLFGQESTMSRMMHMADSEYYWKRFLPVEEILNKLALIKPNDICEVAEKYLKNMPICGSAVGPLPRPLPQYIPERF